MDVLEYGFSCKDFSALSGNASGMIDYLVQVLADLAEQGGSFDFEAFMEDARGSTLQTLLGALRYVLKRRPYFVFIENVDKAILILDSLRTFFDKIGYHLLHSNAVEPWDLRLPVNRPRNYFVAILRNFAAKNIDTEVLQATFVENLKISKEKFRSLPVSELSKHCLPDNAAYLQKMPKMQPASRATPVDEDWPGKHALAFAEIRATRPTASDLNKFENAIPTLTARMRFGAFPLREQEVIFYQAKRFPKVLESSTESVFDFSQCITRSHIQHDKLPCFTGSARLWMMRRQREFSGLEMLAMQGVPVRMMINEGADRFYADMAGNSFCGPCVLFLLFGALQSL